MANIFEKKSVKLVLYLVLVLLWLAYGTNVTTAPPYVGF
jgi:hypothetical protein